MSAQPEKADKTLKLHHLRPAPGANTPKTRVGRGEGGSRGKTAGRGTKGTKARNQVPASFEGGQMPLHMRLPKLKGFHSPFRVEYQVVNLDRLTALYPEGGEVTPDEYRVSKVTGEVLHRRVGTKQVEYRPGPAGPRRIDVAAERREVACLDEEQLGALLELARRVERHFGSHQDIEWALADDGSLFVLQSRPVTTAREKKEARPRRSAIEHVMGTFGADRR